MKTIRITSGSRAEDGAYRALADAADAAADLDTPTSWPTGPTFTQTATLLTEHFDTPGRALPSTGPNTATRTRIRALVRALLT
ncbi:hypothetical protein OHB26_36370 [Nocardia sp. NBC_01503]|uniref:hypothetical protein n=1 Tax=Nocardia sp. NBC_01503 TaxID=2975997 RepID=UPI002E7B0163|nr:hypothetical protein [Nocardia sp. NBC_01503]WTL32285.1 hypothetical protein OHB26_36370 [Nocardia sp. NBC_01503]